MPPLPSISNQSCAKCRGTGAHGQAECSACAGRGRITIPLDLLHGLFGRPRTLPEFLWQLRQVITEAEILEAACRRRGMDAEADRAGTRASLLGQVRQTLVECLRQDRPRRARRQAILEAA